HEKSLIDTWNTVLVKNVEGMVPFTDINKLARYVNENSDAIKGFLPATKLVFNHDYIYDRDGKVHIRPDFLELLEIHKNEKLLNAYLTYREHSFIDNLKDSGFRLDKKLARKFVESNEATGIKDNKEDPFKVI